MTAAVGVTFRLFTRPGTSCSLGLGLPYWPSPSFPRGGPKTPPSCEFLGFPMVWAPPNNKTQEIAKATFPTRIRWSHLFTSSGRVIQTALA